MGVLPRRPGRTAPLLAGGAHDYADPHQTEGRPSQVEAIRMEAIEDDGPEQRADDKYAAIGGKHPAKLAAGLLCGEQTVDSEGNGAGYRPLPFS